MTLMSMTPFIMKSKLPSSKEIRKIKTKKAFILNPSFLPLTKKVIQLSSFDLTTSHIMYSSELSPTSIPSKVSLDVHKVVSSQLSSSTNYLPTIYLTSSLVSFFKRTLSVPSIQYRYLIDGCHPLHGFENGDNIASYQMEKPKFLETDFVFLNLDVFEIIMEQVLSCLIISIQLNIINITAKLKIEGFLKENICWNFSENDMNNIFDDMFSMECFNEMENSNLTNTGNNTNEGNGINEVNESNGSNCNNNDCTSGNDDDDDDDDDEKKDNSDDDNKENEEKEEEEDDENESEDNGENDDCETEQKEEEEEQNDAKKDDDDKKKTKMKILRWFPLQMICLSKKMIHM